MVDTTVTSGLESSRPCSRISSTPEPPVPSPHANGHNAATPTSIGRKRRSLSKFTKEYCYNQTLQYQEEQHKAMMKYEEGHLRIQELDLQTAEEKLKKIREEKESYQDLRMTMAEV